MIAITGRNPAAVVLIDNCPAMIALRSLFAAALATFAAAIAVAQPRGEYGGRPGAFDFYVVALSWSATFCADKGEARRSRQCESGRNPGFVLHGLWPQFEYGYPAYCGPEGRNPDRGAMELAEHIFPDSGLARHQWRKHGTCSGESPSGYFSVAARARAKITIPKAYSAPDQDFRATKLDIERAFSEANPGLRPDMMSVTCARGGRLQEVRICMTRDLRDFRRCEEVNRDSCRARDLLVPAARQTSIRL
jgi:ribonuclease T2